MAPISTKAHGIIDYATGAAMFAAPSVLRIRNRRAAALLWGTGAKVIGSTAIADHEVALRRTVPMPLHLLLDVTSGLGLAALPAATLRQRNGIRSWLPHAVFGVAEVVVAGLTDRRPAQDAALASADTARGATGVMGEGLAARQPAAAGASVAPAPIDTPGPSVTPPAGGSDVERAEWADAARPDAQQPQEHRLEETLVAQETSAAAAEAAMIGGVATPEVDDPSMAPVYQAGGGEQDGWEAVEDALIENATHGDGRGDPVRDALTPELESDASGAVYGEADRIPSTEVIEDPGTGPEDPGAGPGLATERGPGVEPHEDT